MPIKPIKDVLIAVKAVLQGPDILICSKMSKQQQASREGSDYHLL